MDANSQHRTPQGPVWEPQPAGADWVAEQILRMRQAHPDIPRFEELLRADTGGRIADWVDHLHVRSDHNPAAAGFQQASDGWYEHPGALLPPVWVGDSDVLLLRVDSVSDFVVANASRFELQIEGLPLDPWRAAWFPAAPGTLFGVVERHGCSVRTSHSSLSPHEKMRRLEVREQLHHRRRHYDSEALAFDDTQRLLQQAVEQIGRDAACDLFFEGERRYWQGRNRAGRIQYMRQQSLGLGWGNHDHHTYRSSRSCFYRLIRLFELLGFRCREQFYAGAEAGWGAQVLEQPTCGVVIFADVDLDASEIAGDIAHVPLPPRTMLGTIGLWCALHGEALFEAGMHHLECQFDFDGARSQLETLGIRCMKPFTDFPFLRQCFTEGERWSVLPGRIERALQQGLITREQAQRFAVDGAVGSHLEILERNDGYRGFNQTGINDIIRKTDPRFLSVNQTDAPIASARNAGLKT